MTKGANSCRSWISNSSGMDLLVLSSSASSLTHIKVVLLLLHRTWSWLLLLLQVFRNKSSRFATLCPYYCYSSEDGRFSSLSRSYFSGIYSTKRKLYVSMFTFTFIFKAAESQAALESHFEDLLVFVFK